MHFTSDTNKSSSSKEYYFTKFSSLHVDLRYDIFTQTSAYDNDFIMYMYTLQIIAALFKCY